MRFWTGREGREGFKSNYEYILLFKPFFFLPSSPKPQLTNTPLRISVSTPTLVEKGFYFTPNLYSQIVIPFPKEMVVDP